MSFGSWERKPVVNLRGVDYIVDEERREFRENRPCPSIPFDSVRGSLLKTECKRKVRLL